MLSIPASQCAQHFKHGVRTNVFRREFSRGLQQQQQASQKGADGFDDMCGLGHTFTRIQVKCVNGNDL